ncbi:MAG: hypothetical protein AAGE52_08940 [Myxococcota bacterium]
MYILLPVLAVLVVSVATLVGILQFSTNSKGDSGRLQAACIGWAFVTWLIPIVTLESRNWGPLLPGVYVLVADAIALGLLLCIAGFLPHARRVAGWWTGFHHVLMLLVLVGGSYLPTLYPPMKAGIGVVLIPIIIGIGLGRVLTMRASQPDPEPASF